MKKLLFAVFFLTAAICVTAQNLENNWVGEAVDGQHRTVNQDNENKSLAIVGGGSFNGNVTNSSLTVNNKNISINDPSTAITALQRQNSNGEYVAGGAVWNANANGNTLNLSNMTGATVLQGRNAIGGIAVLDDHLERFSNGSANNNTVNLNNVTTQAYNFIIGGNVYGGVAEYSHGTTNGNMVNITNGSIINGNVYGGIIQNRLEPEDRTEPGASDSHADNNRVTINNSTVNGTVAGAAGADTADGNIVIVENNSTVKNVYAVDQSIGVESGDESVTHADNNSVFVRNSTVTGNAAAVSTTSVNASGNTLSIDNSTINAQNLYSVNMGLAEAAASGNPVKATVGNNTLSLTNLTGATFQEAGASLNLVGNTSNNLIQIKDSSITLSNTSGKFFGGTLNVSALNTNNLLVLPSDKGILFGGASMTYTSQVNTAGTATSEEPEAETIATYGTNSDNNTIILSNSIVTGNVIGGFSAYIDEKDYYTSDGTSQTHVVKNGLNTITYVDGVQTQQEDGEKKEDLVFSASNNTIVLDNVNFDGKIYGGYVDGAEILSKNKLTQNNTVILRGDITLTNNSVIYGGNNERYKSTNKLIFDRTRATFNSASQFQNFASMWSINADFDTNLNFNFEGVNANLTVDPSAIKEGQAIVVTSKAGTGLENIQQGEKVVNLIGSGITLNTNKLGIYSFDLSGIKLNSDTVGWQLTGTKAKANLEVYGQLPLVGLALTMEGQEMIGSAVTDAWKNENDSNSFLNGAYHHTRYKTGSGFDLDSGIAQAGAWKKFTNDWLGGFFVKYAHGSYDTFPIDVNGDADVYSGGLMTSLRYSETGRLELDAEIGYMDMEFKSPELSSTFDSKGMYYGFGAGFVETLAEDLDIFANFRYLRKNADDITDNLGQKIDFDSMQSLALRFGGEYIFNGVNLYGLKPAIGAMGIYEMNGESSVHAEGLTSDDASLKGMSGRAQLALVYDNQDTFLPLRTALTVYGMAGKREGFGGEISIAFSF
ncbi:MAG: autotransporter domain-containing protein [Candidatus Avelusimicrobium sp.]|uniref:autotransporter domain-containing protein n=1 Tax=Candidatus Avelusimicrobium sp. TaxID=3048833 RepID=UPI003EFE1B7B